MKIDMQCIRILDLPLELREKVYCQYLIGLLSL